MSTSSSRKEWKPAGIALPSQHKMPTRSLSDCFRWFLPWPMRSSAGGRDGRYCRWPRHCGSARPRRQRGRDRHRIFARSRSQASSAWADALAQAAPEDTIVSRAFSGRPGRSIATDYVRRPLRPVPTPRPLSGPTRPHRADAQCGPAKRQRQAHAGLGRAIRRARPHGTGGRACTADVERGARASGVERDASG